MLRILVTGACGYIGSALCVALEKNHVVRMFDKVLGDDISDLSQVQRKGEDADLVIHLAAIVGLHDVSKDVELARRVNVEGTANICSLGLRTIFSGVLGGYPEGLLVSEETPFSPETPYYQQKLEAEKLVLEARPDNLSLRFGSMYGASPVMRWNLLVHDFINRALSQKKIELFQPSAIRPITNINDAIRVFEFFINRNEGGIYNIASVNLTKQEICEEIKRVTGCRIIHVVGSDPESRNYTASTAKVEALGFKPNPDLANAIKEIVLKWSR